MSNDLQDQELAPANWDLVVANPPNYPFYKKKNGKPLVYPMFLFDPQGTLKAFGSTNPLKISIADPTTPTKIANIETRGSSEVQGNNVNTLTTCARAMVGRMSDLNFEFARTPQTFTDGAWTPAAGKKARVMAFDISAVVTVAGAITVLDGAVVWKTFQLGVGTFLYRALLPANGHLSAAANNVQSIANTGTMTTNVSWEGTEE